MMMEEEEMSSSYIQMHLNGAKRRKRGSITQILAKVSK